MDDDQGWREWTSGAIKVYIRLMVKQEQSVLLGFELGEDRAGLDRYLAWVKRQICATKIELAYRWKYAQHPPV